jgi:hypothetical protein
MVGDEDITPMHMTETPPIMIQGPITRARMGQLHEQVRSFLSTYAYNCEDGMLSNDSIDYIVLMNFGDDHEDLGDQQGIGGKQGGRPSQDGGPIQLRFDYLGHQEQGSLKIVAQAVNGLRFQCSTYVWKSNEITFPMEPVLAQLDFGVDRNSCYKLANRGVPRCRVTYLGHWAVYRVGVH